MKYRKDLWSDFEDLMKQAGSGDCRLAINITEKRVRAHCAPWPLPRVVELSQGAVDAGPSVWRPTLAHQAARTRQRRRWLIPFGANGHNARRRGEGRARDRACLRGDLAAGGKVALRTRRRQMGGRSGRRRDDGASSREIRNDWTMARWRLASSRAPSIGMKPCSMS